MINTTNSIARVVHAPSPVETVPVRRQTLEEVIGAAVQSSKLRQSTSFQLPQVLRFQ